MTAAAAKKPKEEIVQPEAPNSPPPPTPPVQAEEAPKPPEKKRQVGMLVPTRIQFGEHARNVHVATAETGKHPEDFLTPSYWGMVAKNMAPYDHVEVRADDGTFWGLYLVLACDRTWAKLHPIHEIVLPSAQEEEVHPDFKIEWKGPHLKYCVIRLADSSAVHEGEQERRGAITWLEGYAKTIGSPIKALG